jgi:hypothetical protein
MRNEFLATRCNTTGESVSAQNSSIDDCISMTPQDDDLVYRLSIKTRLNAAANVAAVQLALCTLILEQRLNRITLTSDAKLC